MTTLTKPLRRECLSTVRHSGGRTRPVIVELDRGDVLRFRLKGTRTAYVIPIGSAFALAVNAHSQAVKERRKREREERRKAR